MEIDNYPSNSHKNKEAAKKPEKKIEKVVEGTVIRRKKNASQKLIDIFMPEDVSSVKSYIFQDVIIPKIKNVLHDIGSEAWDSFWGVTGRSKSSGASRISYRSYYENKGPERDSTRTQTRSGYGYDDIVLESRGEAEEVLTRMDELVDTYGVVSVADLYDLVGITCQYTDNNYGWTNIHNARVVRIRDGYVIKMPKALPIK